MSLFGVFLVRIFPHSDWIRGNTDKKNFECAHFSRNICFPPIQISWNHDFLVTHFWQIFLVDTPWKHKVIKSFLVFLGGIKCRYIGQKWVKKVFSEDICHIVNRIVFIHASFNSIYGEIYSIYGETFYQIFQRK